MAFLCQDMVVSGYETLTSWYGYIIMSKYDP